MPEQEHLAIVLQDKDKDPQVVLLIFPFPLELAKAINEVELKYRSKCYFLPGTPELRKKMNVKNPYI